MKPASTLHQRLLPSFIAAATEFATRCCGELHLTVLSSQRVENSPQFPSGILSTERGQLHSETRREVYQEKERDVIRAKSAETRRRVRAAAFGRQPRGQGSMASEEPAESSSEEGE